MTPEEAFAAGSGISASALDTAFAWIGATLVLAWAASVVVGQFRASSENEENGHIEFIACVAGLCVFLGMLGLFL